MLITETNKTCSVSSNTLLKEGFSVEQAIPEQPKTKVYNNAGQRRLRTETVDAPKIRAVLDELVNALVKYGNNPDGIPALHAAIKAKDAAAVQLFLDHGADPNARTHHGPEIHCIDITSALDYAIYYGDINIVSVLIDAGAELNRISVCESPLLTAILKNDSSIIEFLVSKGAKLYTGDDPHFCPLVVAARHNYVVALKTLIRLGLSPLTPLADGTTVLSLVCGCYFQENLESIKLLIQSGCAIDCQCLKSVLSCGTQLQQIARFEFFAQYGADFNTIDRNGHSLLSQVCDPAIRAWLLQHGAVN